MMSSGRRFAHAGLALISMLFAGSAFALPSILILTGSGGSSLNVPLMAAGFNVINGTLAPGQIAAGLLDASVVGVYIWNDGSLGNTLSPADPLLAFDATDQAALTAFAVTHNKLIMDGLSWRGNANTDEQNFSKNEALALAAAGGGVVLGADDASGRLIVQHVNQVADWLNINHFTGVYDTPPESQVFGGLLLNTPNLVDPTQVVGTTTYSEVPNGLQPNGDFLVTVLFGSPSGANNCCVGPSGSDPVPVLGPAVFNGITYEMVNHIITTNIPNAGIDPTPGVPEPATLLTLGAALGLVLRRRRRN